MMIVRRKMILCLFVLGALGGEAVASCPHMAQGPPCQEFWRTDAVFIGVATQVVSLTSNTGGMSVHGRPSTVYFTVEEAFKGVEGAALVFDLDPCGYRFKEGERYLVYARRDPNDGKLDVNAGFTRTRPLSEAGEDLAYIRGLSAADTGTRVFGKITRHTLNLKESLLDAAPLGGVRVILEGGAGRQEAVTDGEGSYQFVGLPAGTYRVRAELPAHLRSDEQTVKLTGRGCVPVNIAAGRRGQIAGRVLRTSGEPLAGVPVSIVPADAAPEEMLSEGKERGVWAFGVTDREGRYWFSHLAPGRYLLVINRAEFERSRGAETARSLPRLFYPGVEDAGQATVIVVREQQRPAEYDFQVPLP